MLYLTSLHSVMKSTMWIIISALHITHSQMVLQRRMSRLSRACSTKLKKKAKISTNVLWYIHNTPLTGSLQSPMQILQGRNAISDLPMSNATRKQLGVQPEVIRKSDKQAVLPTHDLCVGQHVMYHDSTSSYWKFVSWTKKLQDNYKRSCYLQENTSTSETFYTSEQDITTYSVCVTTNGTI